MTIAALMITTLGTVSPSAGTQGWESLYSTRTLTEAHATYSRTIGGMWAEDLLDNLAPGDRAQLVDVEVRFPLTDSHPLTFFASSQAVTLPILSVRFLDDLMLGIEWLEVRGCGSGSMADYMGVLAHRPEAFGGRADPLGALGIDRDAAIADPEVNDGSLLSSKSAMYFILAHEAAHVLFRKRERVFQTPQAEEQAADLFALRTMRDIAVIPVGVALWFTMASRWETGRSSSHPLTPERLNGIARYLREHRSAFAAGQANPQQWIPRVIELARSLEGLAEIIGDPGFRDFVRFRSDSIAPASLPGRCPA